ncbi:MAG TPA: hypothetical protein PKD67_09490 [Ignavibacteriaceae bacterium]|nr:hypothetical protein [Ignavibacteriaceae bacterium]
MKQTKLFTAILLVAILFFSGKNFAQQWSPEQKDVWSGVQKYWDVFAKGDAKADLSYYDESYMG